TRRKGGVRSEPFDHAGDRHAEADAHRRDPVARAATLELVHERRGHPGSRRAERMSERDSAAVRIDVLPAILEAGVAGELEHHGCERFVDLDDRYVVPREPGTRKGFRAGLWIPVQHAMRVDAGEAERDESRPRLEVETRNGRFARDEHSS